MRKISDIPFFWKLILPLLVVNLLWIGSATYTILGISESQQLFRNLYIIDVGDMFKLQQQDKLLLKFNQLLLSHLSNEDFIAIEADNVKLNEIQKKLYSNFDEIISNDGKHQLNSSQKIEIFEILKKNFARLFESSSKVIQLSNDFEKESAFDLFNNDVSPLLNEISENSSHLINLSAKSMSRSYDKSLMLEQKNLLQTQIMSVLVSLFALTIFFLLAKYTSNRLLTIAKWANSMSSGNSELRLEISNTDEIGDLECNLNEMADNLKQSRKVEQLALIQAQNAKDKAEQNAIETKILAHLLRISLEHENLKEYLDEVLAVLLNSIPWLKILPKAGIFLTKNQGDSKQLELIVARDLSLEILQLCANIPFGCCLCGRAAQEQRIQFADCIDHRHDIS
jgi:HAMP domain-containing protein